MNVEVDISNLIKKLERSSENGSRIIKAVVQANGDQMVADAKSFAPADLGKLRQSIGKEFLDDGYNARMFVNEAYAGYVEFGTGAYVDVPPELAGVAEQYRGKGLGSWSDFKLAITDWMKRHGIEEKYAWAIMVSIMRKGVKPQPFIYPAFIKARGSLKRNLEIALKEELKKQSFATRTYNQIRNFFG